MGEKDYDPRMHSCEHILNGTIAKMYGCDRAFSTHIEKKKSKIDFRFSRELTRDEMDNIETIVNDIISKNVEITDFFVSKEEAATKYNLSRLPDDAGDEVRIVKIGEYDQCPCIGEHLQNTSQIGAFLKIISSDFNEVVLRVRFKLVEC